MTKTLALFGAAAALLSACASSPMMPMMKVDNAALPEAVRVPAGQKQLMATTGVGEITYECREKKDMAGAHEWAFVAPVATLYAADRKVVAMGAGAMQGVSFIQRLNTKGGVAPAMACDAAGKGKRQQVAYEADYVFYGS
jgi:Protein of unknown function (DUF3455)